MRKLNYPFDLRIKRLNESKEDNNDFFIEEIENFFITSELFTHEDDDEELCFSYKYCVYVNEDKAYLDLVLSPISLPKKKLNAIAQSADVDIKDVMYFDIYTYGAGIPLTAIDYRDDSEDECLKAMEKEIKNNERLFGFMMDKHINRSQTRWEYIHGMVNERKTVISHKNVKRLNESATLSVNEKERLLEELEELANESCYIDSYTDEFGCSHNPITDVIIEYFADLENWHDYDKPCPWKFTNVGLYRLAFALINYDYIMVMPNGKVNVKEAETTNMKRISEICNKLIGAEILKKAYDDV